MNDIKALLSEFKNMKVNDEEIIKLRQQYELEKMQDKKLFIHQTTDKEYWDANVKNIGDNFKNFYLSDKIFCWITGGIGSGKTYSINAIRNYEILNKNNYNFNIVMENELEYSPSMKYSINAIDNLTINEGKMKYLNNLLFDIFDFHWKNHKKLYITTTQKLDDWLNSLYKFCMENAQAISSRLSNRIEIIDLGNLDKRKNNV